jgi:hypothetical protein
MSRLSELEKKRDLTRAALNEKLNALENRVRSSIDDARETVKRAVDLQYQVEKRPLIILGCSAVVGYFLGRVWFTGSRSGEAGVENGTESHKDKAAKGNSWNAQAGLLKSALTAAMSKLLVEFIKEVMPFRSDDVGNTAQSEPQVSPDAAEWTKE